MVKQKVARTFNGRKVDLDVVKKEIKDELTHVLYDQTRRTPIVIPVINEIGGGGKPQNSDQNREGRGDNRGQNGEGQPKGQNRGQGGNRQFKRPAPKNFPAPVVPDSEATEPKQRTDARGY